MLFISHWKFSDENILKKYVDNIKLNIKGHYKTLRNDMLFSVLLLIFFTTVTWISIVALLYPATDFDGNSYHLTTVANVIQNGSINDVPTSLPWLNGYPKAGELVGVWNVLIPGKDLIVDIVQIPFMLLGVLSTYYICVSVGANKRNSRFASLLFLFIPVVLNQLKTTYVDVMLCALFLVALSYVIEKTIHKLDLIMLGLTYALIISLKYTGFLFVLVTLPILFWHLYLDAGRNIKNWRYYISRLAAVCIPASLGLYWYLKNYYLYNTPLYPFGLKLMGYSIFPGKTFQEFADGAVTSVSALPRGYFSRIWFVWTEQKDWYGCFYNYDSNFTGFGPIWFILLMPSILVSFVMAYRKRNRPMLMLQLSMMVLFFIYPANYYTRYTIFVIGLGLISFAYVLTNIHSLLVNRLLKCIAVVLAITVLITNVTLCNFSPNTLEVQIDSFKSRNFRGGSTYVNTLGEAYVYMQNSVGEGDTIAYDSSPYYIYPLWRADYKNKVIYVPADSKDEWINSLRSSSVDYVFTQNISKENTWIKQAAGFELIYKDDMYEIYKTN